ncbi:MAG: hypothetical protein U0525_02120 [Patescibacteria group bacterium]
MIKEIEFEDQDGLPHIANIRSGTKAPRIPRIKEYEDYGLSRKKPLLQQLGSFGITCHSDGNRHTFIRSDRRDGSTFRRAPVHGHVLVNGTPNQSTPIFIDTMNIGGYQVDDRVKRCRRDSRRLRHARRFKRVYNFE